MKEKLHEALVAVCPVIAIVLLLSFTIAPVSPSVLLSFLLGAVLVMIGMMFFTLGAEISMTPMGEKVGAKMTQSRSIPLIISLAFVLGVIITISEPDLQVLAGLVPSVPSQTLILAVAVGVGISLVAAILRILLGISLHYLLVVLYIIAFTLMNLVPESFRAIAFDSGGVTTGPMTVPFIMALGVGISSIRNDRSAADDSFGLVALCSIGPIIAVLTLGLIFPTGEGAAQALHQLQVQDTVELGKMFAVELPAYMLEIARSLLPIIAFFALFQLVSLRLKRRPLIKIVVGLVYTYIGLVLFLTGANVGFMPAGSYLGQVLGARAYRFLLVPIGAVIGFFIVKAEPAVYVLNHQVEEITEGAISARAMGMSLSLGVAASVALAMIRVLTGLPILYFLLPGYAVAIILSFFVPKIFTAIAFDSGGVASGPMTATFLLPLAQGACMAVGGNLVTDAFGVVAMVAMTPLITIQILGVVTRIKQRAGKRRAAVAQPVVDLIIEL
ncbi:MAG: DUF1538 domain-containing protein [Firmicutes bacterium]|nr:DUF1538 domain-containing protein [Bacillota bacterium]